MSFRCPFSAEAERRTICCLWFWKRNTTKSTCFLLVCRQLSKLPICDGLFFFQYIVLKALCSWVDELVRGVGQVAKWDDPTWAAPLGHDNELKQRFLSLSFSLAPALPFTPRRCWGSTGQRRALCQNSFPYVSSFPQSDSFAPVTQTRGLCVWPG